MILIEAFDPIEVGEVNDFTFAFTAEAFEAYLLDAHWECRMMAYSEGFDPDPQSRIVATQVQRVVTSTRNDGSIEPVHGQFAIARVGPMPPSAAGATYLLRAIGFMSDGRKLARSGYVTCIQPG